MQIKHTEITATWRIAGIGMHVAFALLAGLAGWFWPERTLILDAAFQSYLFVASGQPAIMVERFGAVGVQLLPLAAVHLGAPLATVLFLYSISIVLWHWLLYTICWHGLRDRRAATSIFLFVILLSGDCFYWMQNELLQGISLSLVLWSLWARWAATRQPLRWSFANVLRGLGSVLLATTVVYFHPLMVFPLGFVWCFWWLHADQALRRPWLLGIAVLFTGLFASKYLLRTPNFYDRGMTGQYVREFHFSLDRLLHSRGLRDFWAHCDDSLLLFWPLLAGVVGFYLWQKRWLLTTLVVGATSIYLLLILQRYLDDDRWYIAESHYQALAVFLVLPLVWDIFPQLRARAVWWPVIAGLIMFRLVSIYQNHYPYTARLAYVRTLLEATRGRDGRKFYLPPAVVQRQTLLMNWGLPFETLQISALESPDSVRVLVVADETTPVAALPRDSMVSFLQLPRRAFHDLPAPYYRLRSTLPYQLLLLHR